MASSTGAGSLTTGNILSRTFSVWKGNALAYGVLGILLGSPVVLATILDPNEENFVLQLIAQLGSTLSGLIVSGAVAFGVFQQLRGERVPLNDCLQKGISRIGPLFVTGIVVSILVTLGMVCLIIPGIILMCGLYVAVPVATVENPGLVDALKRSWSLTMNHKVTIFSSVFVLGILMAILAIPVGIAIGFTAGDNVFAIAVLQIVMLFFSAIGGVMGAVVYHDLRVKKEGLGTDELVKVFE